jgi:hypothetical protein
MDDQKMVVGKMVVRKKEGASAMRHTLVTFTTSFKS